MLLGSAITLAEACAGVIRHDRTETQAVELARQFPAACCISDFYSGVLVDPRWVLTCAHGTEFYDSLMGASKRFVNLGDERFRVIGLAIPKARKPIDLKVRRSSVPEEENLSNLHDIALLRLDRSVSNVAPAVLSENNGEVGKIGVSVGCGTWIDDPVEGVSIDRLLELSRGKMHAGTNRIEIHLKNAKRLGATFDSPDDTSATDLECGWGAGDSGGPLFLRNSAGEWRVAGVLSQGDTIAPDRIGKYGDRFRWTRVADYRAWIKTTIEKDDYTPFEEPKKADKSRETTVKWPDTVAGRLGREFIVGLQAPDDNLLREFFQRHYSASALMAKSLDDRVRHERAINEEFGPLRPIRLSHTGEFKIRIAVSAEGVEFSVFYEFEFHKSEPHRIIEMAFGPDLGH